MATAAAIGEAVKNRKVRGRNCNVWFGDMHITKLTNVDINFILFHFHFLANALDDGANAKALAKPNPKPNPKPEPLPCDR